MTHWLIDSQAHEQLSQLGPALFTPNAAQLAEVTARETALRSGAPSRILSRQGRTARVEITGILTPRPSILALLFSGGGTSYAEIRAAIEEAEGDASVESVVFVFDTPGGAVAGLFETIDALSRMTKPKRAEASLAASAGYGLAASAGKIKATSRAAAFGSIGVAASFFVSPSVVDVTSTDAPNKRPDVTTEPGRAVVRAYLDEIHSLFVDAIATGRGTSRAAVNANFGRGSMLLASAAKEAGMIDSIAASPSAAGPLPRRRAGESDESLRARLSEWVTAGGDDLPVVVLAERMKQAQASLASKDVSHGDDEALPTRAWSGSRDLGEQLAEAMGATSNN